MVEFMKADDIFHKIMSLEVSRIYDKHVVGE